MRVVDFQPPVAVSRDRRVPLSALRTVAALYGDPDAPFTVGAINEFPSVHTLRYFEPPPNCLGPRCAIPSGLPKGARQGDLLTLPDVTTLELIVLENRIDHSGYHRVVLAPTSLVNPHS